MPTLKRKTIDKQINCILPENLDPQALREQINSLTTTKKPVTDTQFWRYLRFIDLLTSDRRKDDNGWVMLWYKILAINLTGAYKKVIEDLKALRIIEVKQNNRGTDSYSADNDESKQYRLTDTFRDEATVLVHAFKRVDPKQPKIEIEDKKTELLLQNASTPEYNFLLSNLHKLRYDVEAVESDFEEWLAEGVRIKNVEFNEVTREMMRRTVESLNSDSVSFTIGMTGRITTDLTSSYKVLRRRLVVDGYEGEIMQADVTSAQIILMLHAMRTYRDQLTDPIATEELNQFEALLKTREFYKTLSLQLEAEGVQVSNPKTDFLRKVCNHNEKHRENPFYAAFKKLYPTVTEFLRVLKKGMSFTTVMTPVEAELFNNRIARRVYKELGSQTFIAGIYDAFIFKKDDESEILRIMNEEVYKATGLMNMVKVTTLKEESEKHITYPNRQPEPTPAPAPVVEPVVAAVALPEPQDLKDKENREVVAPVEKTKADKYSKYNLNDDDDDFEKWLNSSDETTFDPFTLTTEEQEAISRLKEETGRDLSELSPEDLKLLAEYNLSKLKKEVFEYQYY
ncbi:hypothetical protein [Pontibacter pamirensis]|uniref:hypothetical protein n=1 Tax=Pontibacter pamirensis TaxID=2562824 RepID=UPI0013897901|nr:hypothetical protein [Pontibacter pamirensis]